MIDGKHTFKLVTMTALGVKVTVKGPLGILCCRFLNPGYHGQAGPSGFFWMLLETTLHKVDHVQRQVSISQGQHI